MDFEDLKEAIRHKNYDECYNKLTLIKDYLMISKFIVLRIDRYVIKAANIISFRIFSKIWDLHMLFTGFNRIVVGKEHNIRKISKDWLVNMVYY